MKGTDKNFCLFKASRESGVVSSFLFRARANILQYNISNVVFQKLFYGVINSILSSING